MPYITLKCNYCKKYKEIYQKPSQKPRKYCNPKCCGKANSGENCNLFGKLQHGEHNPMYKKFHTEESCRQISETRKKRLASGDIIHNMKGRNHTEKTRELMKIGQKESYRSGKRTAPKHTNIGFYRNDVWLGSKWEGIVAEILDENNIKYDKDYPLIYDTKDGESHTFLLDFYLPDYNIGIEVKSEYTVIRGGERELEKIAYCEEHYKWITWLWTEKECKNFDVANLQ